MDNKLDPYKHRERYLEWKEASKAGIIGLSRQNEYLIKKYLSDMENGLNIGSVQKKGARSFPRLNALRHRMLFIAQLFKKKFALDDLTHVDEQQLHDVFRGMREGTIKRADGKTYQSVKDYVKDFKTFWHWWQRINRKIGKEIGDITVDLDTSGEKPKWVYLTEADIKRLTNKAKYEYKVLIWFLFDTGIRAPTELMNIKVSDLLNDYKELDIRQEISKTFGRRIKLMLCSESIREYIKEKGLRSDDYLFKISPPVVNRYLKRLARKILGEGVSPAREKYSELTMYDFRHCSSCYWLPKYKNESAIKYRFGWKNSDKIHYYSELLGMSDTICQEDMFTSSAKTELEKNLEITKKQNDLLQERQRTADIQLLQIMELVKQLESRLKQSEGIEAQ